MGKFVLAIDSFKGCLSSAEVELAAERGIRAVDEKAEIVKSLGVDYLVNIPFTHEIMTMIPKDFIEKILLDILKQMNCKDHNKNE